ncbi:MAG: hypothetical protein PHO56_00780 [Patescibacteria group bacterium]|nr:hypothetical protein [Patescibacteria group bacterium]
MLKKGNVLILFLFVVLTFFLTPSFATLYEMITGTNIRSGSWADVGFGHPEYFEGFFLSSAFILTLGIILFAGKFRYWIFAIVIGLESLLLLVIQSFGPLIVDACASLIAIILGEAILFAKRRITS